MTTNHRPTLESKRGRDIAIKNTIQHARSAKGHTSLKLRSDLCGAQIDHFQGQKALRELESDRKRQNRGTSSLNNHAVLNKLDDSANVIIDEKSAVTEMIDHRGSRNAYGSFEPIEKQKSGVKDDNDDDNANQNFLIKENKSVSNASDSEEASDSEDDTEALMLELKKVREEEMKRSKKRTEVDVSNITSNTSKKMGTKRPWRGSSASAFSRGQASKAKEECKSKEESFTTDSLSSSIHKQFLSKYFR